jgi:U3 small nucleolar ribonucleoprotein protein IMP3
MSLRKLKHHEQKLLKKVDFVQWNNDDTIREGSIISRYHLQGPEEYGKYQKLVLQTQTLVRKLKSLESNDPYRTHMSNLLTQKLYTMGVIEDAKSLVQAHRVSVSGFCRRRIAVLLIKLKMAQNMKDATRFIKHGHVRIGPNTITDPAFLVTRPMEDFLTWTDSSKVKRTIMAFNNKLDDYDTPGLSEKRKKKSTKKQQKNKQRR